MLVDWIVTRKSKIEGSSAGVASVAKGYYIYGGGA